MKIGFTGTMSVGKTTLVKRLQSLSEFKNHQFENYKFATERSAYLNSLGIPLNYETTIEGQTIFLAERITELIQPKIITDRTILDVMAFTNRAPKISIMDKDAFAEYASRFIKKYDYIFYISPKGIGIENNGIRETDANYRAEIDEEIQKLILKYCPTYHELSGSTDERVIKIIETIQPQYVLS